MTWMLWGYPQAPKLPFAAEFLETMVFNMNFTAARYSPCSWGFRKIWLVVSSTVHDIFNHFSSHVWIYGAFLSHRGTPSYHPFRTMGFNPWFSRTKTNHFGIPQPETPSHLGYVKMMVTGWTPKQQEKKNFGRLLVPYHLVVVILCTTQYEIHIYIYINIYYRYILYIIHYIYYRYILYIIYCILHSIYIYIFYYILYITYYI